MRKPSTFRLKETTTILLTTLADQEDVSRTAMIEMLVKAEAKRRHLAVPLTVQQRADLDADPWAQDCIRRIIEDDEPCYLAGPDGGPSDELYVPSGNELPVDDRRLAELEQEWSSL